MSPRAVQILGQVDRIAAEDTRTSRKLLQRYGIPPPILEPYHVRNEAGMARRLAERLRLGDSVALVTDAGTPGRLRSGVHARARRARGGGAGGPGAGTVGGARGSGRLRPAHGPLPLRGVPPRRPGPRRQLLRSLAELPHTLVFFEAPPRLIAFLTDVHAVLGNRAVAIARELTKVHEELWRGKVADYLAAHAEGRPPRGELTVVVEGASRRRAREDRA